MCKKGTKFYPCALSKRPSMKTEKGKTHLTTFEVVTSLNPVSFSITILSICFVLRPRKIKQKKNLHYLIWFAHWSFPSNIRGELAFKSIMLQFIIYASVLSVRHEYTCKTNGQLNELCRLLRERQTTGIRIDLGIRSMYKQELQEKHPLISWQMQPIQVLPIFIT